MKKLIFTICFSVGIFLIGSSVSAFTASSIELNDAPANPIYVSTFDNLVLDFKLTVSGTDTLKTMVIKNNGSAEDLYHINKMKLWADAGAVGFQGMGVDTQLGNLVYFNNYWYLDNLSAVINDSQRFFVSIDASASFSKTAYTQMLIPVLSDISSNGIYDLGDAGIFLASKNNGPTDSSLLNSPTQFFSANNIDSFGPKMVVSNLTNNQTLTTDNLNILGFIRDQGGTYIRDFTISIDGAVSDINNRNFDDYSWSYYWENISNGTHTIKFESHDGGGNYSFIGPLTVTVNKATTPPVTPPVTPGIQPLSGLAFGDLIKASSQAVYYYGADGKRYVFPNERIFKSWYADFSTVKTISDTDLASLVVGGNVTYRPGAKLIKIATDPKVYAISKGGTLRWITTEALAISLYGADWASKVEDVEVSLYMGYKSGADINSVSDYNIANELAGALNINSDLGL